MRLLLLDDGVARQDLAGALRSGCHAVDCPQCAAEAGGLAAVYAYDALIVRVGLEPGADAGLRFVRDLRAAGVQTPVLLISAGAELADRLAGFEAGADDYVLEPYEVAELIARLRAVTRRARPQPVTVRERGPLRLDLNARSVDLGGRPVHLTAKEYGILELLATYPGRLFKREEIIARVWNADFVADTNVVDVYVSNLRRKLGGHAVQTVRGLGYRFPATAA